MYKLFSAFIAIMPCGCFSNFDDLRDRATKAALVCDLTGNSVMGLEVFRDPNISSDCRARILFDFRAEELTPESEQALINGAWSLLKYDWEKIDDPSLYGELAHAREHLGIDQPEGFLIYSWVTSQFRRTTYKFGKNSAAAYNGHYDELRMDDYMTPFNGALGLVHEAHHAATGSRHVRCPNSPAYSRQCDRGVLGAYSASIAIVKAAPETTDEYVDLVIERNILGYQDRVLEE